MSDIQVIRNRISKSLQLRMTMQFIMQIVRFITQIYIGIVDQKICVSEMDGNQIDPMIWLNIQLHT